MKIEIDIDIEKFNMATITTCLDTAIKKGYFQKGADTCEFVVANIIIFANLEDDKVHKYKVIERVSKKQCKGIS